jgi:hypothetical protein
MTGSRHIFIEPFPGWAFAVYPGGGILRRRGVRGGVFILQSHKATTASRSSHLDSFVVKAIATLELCSRSTLCGFIVIPGLSGDIRAANAAEISRLRFASLGMAKSRLVQGVCGTGPQHCAD